MNLFSIVLISAVLLGQIVQAQTETGSSSHRKKKKFSIVAHTEGVRSDMSEVGGIFTYHLDEGSMLDFGYARGRHLARPTSGIRISTDSYSVMFKQFVRSSFYLKIGLDYQVQDYVDTEVSNGEIKAAFKGSTLNGSFCLGNQWYFETLTIGADWFGFSVPFAKSAWDKFATPSQEQFLEGDIDRRLGGTHYTFVRFYLGASF